MLVYSIRYLLVVITVSWYNFLALIHKESSRNKVFEGTLQEHHENEAKKCP